MGHIPPLPPCLGKWKLHWETGSQVEQSQEYTQQEMVHRRSLCIMVGQGGGFQKAREVGQTSRCKRHSIPLIHKCIFLKKEKSSLPKIPLGIMSKTVQLNIKIPNDLQNYSYPHNAKLKKGYCTFQDTASHTIISFLQRLSLRLKERKDTCGGEPLGLVTS